MFKRHRQTDRQRESVCVRERERECVLPRVNFDIVQLNIVPKFTRTRIEFSITGVEAKTCFVSVLKRPATHALSQWQ